MIKKNLPTGWTEDKIKRVLNHYEAQSPDDASKEDDDAFHDSTQTYIQVPNRLIPSVRRLLLKKQHA